ncbi:MAG: trypsin-like serine protease [Nannocystaceae bacterium]|nr:trypsin-like serine protease [Nannocystaceae bacterium]
MRVGRAVAAIVSGVLVSCAASRDGRPSRSYELLGDAKVINARPTFVESHPSIVAIIDDPPSCGWGEVRSDALDTKTPCTGSFYSKIDASPTLARCAGLVVAPDLVLTARHCIIPTENRPSIFEVLLDYAQGPVSSSRRPRRRDVAPVARACHYGIGAGVNDWIVLKLEDRLDASRVFRGRVESVNLPAKGTMFHYPFGVPLSHNPVSLCDSQRSGTIRTVVSSENHSSGGPIFVADQGERVLVGMHIGLGWVGGKPIDCGDCYRERQCSATCGDFPRACPHGEMVPGNVLAAAIKLSLDHCPEEPQTYTWDSRRGVHKPVRPNAE